ncbi:hypothetical protein M569_05106, partial [Genlisea aurea]
DDDLGSGNAKNVSSYSEVKDIEPDHPQAVWVKWRGKWEPGIKCARVDWPLSTLKAKPTHDRKQYLVIFFPRTRNYSWADVLLIRSIDELPKPIAYTSHVVGVKMVKDLSVASRFIMQKLAVAMLNILDQLNREALVECVRNVGALKDFALEVSRCKAYSDLGGMLLKVEMMILPRFMNSEWLQKSSISWKQQCRVANSAECVEILKDELSESILWNEVSIVTSEADMGFDWKTWKQEAMKLFSVSNPSAVSFGSELCIVGGDGGGLSSSSFGNQISRKRPKLEVRRSDSQLSSSPLKDSLMAESSSPPDKWDGGMIAVDENDKATPSTSAAPPKFSDSGSHNRQCAAFIESKGRQCVRFANEGEVFCCVHLASRSREASAGKPHPADAAMCEGTTVLGTKCKHRALPGSSFCKKHRPQDGKVSTTATATISAKRKIEDRRCENPFPRKESEEPPPNDSDGSSSCIGSWPEASCPEAPVRHSLYCGKHIPNWLKRARNGKSRIVSKEVFLDLLRSCRSRDRKLQLHQACELFYRFFKGVLSLRNQVPEEAQFRRAVAESSRDGKVGNLLMRLVSMEKERLARLWGFGDDGSFPAVVEERHNGVSNDGDDVRCKLCPEGFSDDGLLGAHWMESHKKEAQWLFRGYVCAICLDSFTNRKVLEAHVQQRHHVEFVENCMLMQCIPCGSHFGSSDELWSHVLRIHPRDLRLPRGGASASPWRRPEPLSAGREEAESDKRRFVCRFCGLKFDLLPDLGRHHQAAHMAQAASSKVPRSANSEAVEFDRHRPPRFKKGSDPAICGNRRMPEASLEGSSLGRLADVQCSAIAKMLTSEMKKTISRPDSSELMAAARSSCCRASLRDSLEAEHGSALPEKLHLRVAKLCSEEGIPIEWHRDGWTCPKGCIARKSPSSSSSPALTAIVAERRPPSSRHHPTAVAAPSSEWTMDESHCVIDSQQFSNDLSEKNIVLCDDISFGKESVPIACVVDENLLNAEEPPDGQTMDYSFPWESFTYATTSLLHHSLVLEPESWQLGCSCEHTNCSSNACDHVYLFSSDHADANDVYGNPMQGRSPYDERGRIILEEGYVVYECNERCRCGRDCPNRVLQNGIAVKLEIFKTERKGWAVRAREAILRGTFVCEYVGEVVDGNEADERRKRYPYGCGYFYEVARFGEDDGDRFFIDATNYGNVSRYINHSCSSNLVNHRVLVESMDCRMSHFGFYAGRDIAMGEELTYDFHYKKLREGEDGCACLCGSSNCRGRLY